MILNPKRKVLGYVLDVDEHTEAKRAAIEHVGQQCGRVDFRITVARHPPQSEWCERGSKTRRFQHQLTVGVPVVVWLRDLGNRVKPLRHTVDRLIQWHGLVLLLPGEQEALVIRQDPRGVDSLTPADRERLEGAILTVNRAFKHAQQAKSAERLAKQRLKQSRFPPLGKKFRRHPSGQVFVIDDPDFPRRVRQLLKWRAEGLSIPKIRARLSRGGARNPATGRVWGLGRVARAFSWAKKNGIHVDVV